MDDEADDNCKWCGGLKSVRMPVTAQCDHLYWPDYLTPVQKQANGIKTGGGDDATGTTDADGDVF